jgi:3-hydroxyisobutyrate dehydrogenase-like beta-hydroxyacid dehydrogenase
VGRVGSIGLGFMGGALVTRIAAAGFPMVLWARRAVQRVAEPMSKG